MKIKLELSTGHIIFGTSDAAALLAILAKGTMKRQEYISGKGYVYMTPEADRPMSPQIDFIDDSVIIEDKEDCLVVKHLNKEMNAKQTEVYSLNKQIKELQESVNQLTALVSPSHTLQVENDDE